MDFPPASPSTLLTRVVNLFEPRFKRFERLALSDSSFIWFMELVMDIVTAPTKSDSMTRADTTTNVTKKSTLTYGLGAGSRQNHLDISMVDCSNPFFWLMHSLEVRP